jgi:preprotein translocase subunit SecE
VKIEIYKKGQGRYTRIITFVSVTVIAVAGAAALSDKMGGYDVPPYVRFGVPTAVVVALGLLMFWLMNRPKTADFLIATEGEMKKVSWSSKKEIIGSTKVVIITTFIMATLLFAVDLLFVVLFRWMNIMG